MKSGPVEVGNGEYNARIDLNVFSKDVFVFAVQLGTISYNVYLNILFVIIYEKLILRFSEWWCLEFLRELSNWTTERGSPDEWSQPQSWHVHNFWLDVGLLHIAHEWHCCENQPIERYSKKMIEIVQVVFRPSVAGIPYSKTQSSSVISWYHNSLKL